MRGAREQLLAGAGLAAQQHGRVGAGRDIDLAEHGADRWASPDDADQRMFAVHDRSARRLFFQAPLFVHHSFTVARDHVVKMQSLANHRRDHGQKARVGIGRRAMAAVGRTVDGEKPYGLAPIEDGRGDQGLGLARAARIDRPAEKIGIGLDIVDDQGRLAGFHRAARFLPRAASTPASAGNTRHG